MNSSRAVRNILTTLGTQIVSWSLAVLIAKFVPGYLKETGFGALNVAWAFPATFSFFVALGSSPVIVMEIARDRSLTGELVWTNLWMRFVFCIAASGIGMLVALLLRYEPTTFLLISLALGVMALIQVNELLYSALLGLEAVPRANAAQLVEKLVGGAITIGLVFLRAPIWAFILAPTVGTLISIGMNFSAFVPHLRTFWQKNSASKKPRWETVHHLIQAGWPFMMANLLFAIWEPGNNILLSKICTLEVVSWYGLAKKLGGTAMAIPTAVAYPMMPVLARLYREDEDKFAMVVRQLIKLMLVCAAPIAAFLILMPSKIIHLLNYPAGYLRSVPVLMMMGAALVIWYLSQIVGMALITSDRQHVITRTTLRTVIVCLPLCAGCIYATQRLFHNGALGAMLADILIEIGMLTSYCRALPQGTYPHQGPSILFRAFLAVTPLLWLLHQVHYAREFYLVIPGILLYPILCRALHVFDATDIQLLKESFGKKFAK